MQIVADSRQFFLIISRSRSNTSIQCSDLGGYPSKDQYGQFIRSSRLVCMASRSQAMKVDFPLVKARNHDWLYSSSRNSTFEVSWWATWHTATPISLLVWLGIDSDSNYYFDASALESLTWETSMSHRCRLTHFTGSHLSCIRAACCVIFDTFTIDRW